MKAHGASAATALVDAVRVREGYPIAVGAKGLAKFLDISESMLHALRTSGRLIEPTCRLGSLPKWSIVEVEAWLLAGAPNADRWRAMRERELAKWTRRA